jgi:hypothetical protein
MEFAETGCALAAASDQLKQVRCRESLAFCPFETAQFQNPQAKAKLIKPRDE